MGRISRCRSAPRFFGLKPSDRVPVLLEAFFLLGYYFGMSWPDFYSLPVAYKFWLIKRIEKEINQNAEAGQPGKGAHENVPSVRALMGKHRAHVPAKLRRFT
jgi:hypothetical protein